MIATGPQSLKSNPRPLDGNRVFTRSSKLPANVQH